MSMFYQLPPVGNPISCHVDDLSALNERPEPVLFSSYLQRLYNSGTAALAASIMAAHSVIEKQRKITAPEVILPAYACPDLVSAAEFAGIKPILVDIEADRPWLDLLQLSRHVNNNTVAIVAVNLFGIAERWSQLRSIADKNNVVLIEDSAQYFPGEDEEPDWQGDFVVFSFGRGKPVSLLGGGAVICRDEGLLDQLPVSRKRPVSVLRKLSFFIKANLYNAMISPCLYGVVQAMPFLHLGETRYHTLRAVSAIDGIHTALLDANISRYQKDIQVSARCQKISSMLATLSDTKQKFQDLPQLCESTPDRRLLRYPLLIEPDLRDRLYTRLKRSGLGVSLMYPASLPGITGLKHLIDEGQYPGAEGFAARILTLPTHGYVSEKDIDRIKVILEDTLR